MLTREALQSALPLATTLDERGVFLTPVENTPLEALVHATRSDVVPVVPTDGGRFSLDLENILYMANCKDRATGQCDHDAALDNVVAVAVEGVRGHIAFARNVVAAAVSDLADKTCDALRTLNPSTLLGLEVQVYSFPSPLESSQLETSVQRFSDDVPNEPRLSARLPQRTYAELLEIIGSGSGSLDKDVQAWLAAKGETFLTSLWEGVFTQKPYDLTDAAKSFSSYTEDRECGLDNAMAIFLLARKLAEQPIEGVEMPLVAFENLMAEFRGQAGLRLKRAYVEMDNINKLGVLVRSTTQRVTVVNDKVYRAWIEAGGDNEVLFGNMLDSVPQTLVENIDAKAAELKAAWTRHATLTATVESNRKFSRTKEILERTFRAQLNEIAASDDTVRNNSDLVLSRFREELETVRERDLEDLYGLCLRLVCRSRFAHTSAEEILTGIDRIKCENPKIDQREAAAVAVIEYIAKWVATQFRVIKR